MIKPSRPTGYLAALFVLDILCLQLAIPVAMQMRYVLPFGRTVLPEWADQLFYAPTIWLHVVVFLVWTTCLILASVYTPRKVAFWGEEMQRLLLGHVAAGLVLAGILYLSKAQLPRLMFAYFFILALCMMIGSRLILRAWYALRHKPTVMTTRLLVAGDAIPGTAMVRQLWDNAWPGIELEGLLVDTLRAGTVAHGDVLVLGPLSEAEEWVENMRADAVLLAFERVNHDTLAALVSRLNRLPVRLYIVPDFLDLAFFDATIEQLGNSPVIGLREPAIDGLQRILKRVVDIVISAAALVLLSPVMLGIAAAIKLEDGGPVLYQSARMGENGRAFHMFKFRSMIVGADKIGADKSAAGQTGASQGGAGREPDEFHKEPDDPRVTRVGRFLRRTSLDELPQFYNVLRGDMSLVGPRPELPDQVSRYAAWQHKRFAVPQGMTGWWQINGRADSPLQILHTDEDLYYVQHYSLWLDLQILWRTVLVVLRGRGSI